MEALVSITLLSIGLVPVFWQSTQALALSSRVKNTTIASNLAQEGVELTRAIRDTNWLLQQPTWEGMNGCGAPIGCEIAFDAPALVQVIDAPRPLRFVPDLGLYQYTSGQQTQFDRVITVTSPSGNADERVITSTVSWRERGKDMSVSLEYHLFDWLQ